MKNEDAQLVDQFLTGDESAFTTLIKNTRKVYTRSLGGKLVISISLKNSRRTHS